MTFKFTNNTSVLIHKLKIIYSFMIYAFNWNSHIANTCKHHHHQRIQIVSILLSWMLRATIMLMWMKSSWEEKEIKFVIYSGASPINDTCVYVFVCKCAHNSRRDFWMKIERLNVYLRHLVGFYGQPLMRSVWEDKIGKMPLGNWYSCCFSTFFYPSMDIPHRIIIFWLIFHRITNVNFILLFSAAAGYGLWF